MIIALASVLGLIFVASILLDRTLLGLPVKELRRRARSQKDKRAGKIYKLAALGRSAELFLRLIGAFSATGLILLAAYSSWWLGLVVALLVIWLVWKGQTPQPINGWRLWLVALLTPLVAMIVSFLQPVLGRLTDLFKRLNPLNPPTGIFEKEDLLEFLKIQARQPTNRIAPSDLKMAHSVLRLDEKTAGQVMLPRRQIKWVTAADPISPMIMDELHKSGQIRFPVVKEITKVAEPEILGVLYLQDLLEHLEEKGHIRDIMHPGISYVNESQTLRSVLNGFLQSGQHLLMVVNNFEEVVGILTLEGVLQQIFGDKISDDFNRYHDKRSVATFDKKEL